MSMLIRLILYDSEGKLALSMRKHRTIGAIMIEWLQRLLGRSAPRADPEECFLIRLDRNAKDLGLTSEELLDITINAYHTTDLLPLRMSLLHLDPDHTARTDPTLFLRLEESCKLCGSKGTCALDIIQNAAGPQWQGYCPNVATLRAMQAKNISEPK